MDKSYSYCKQVDWKKKFWISLISALIFILIASPSTYALTSRFVKGFTKNGIPTALGLLAHGLVFFIIIYALMMPWKASEACICKENAECPMKLHYDKSKMMDLKHGDHNIMNLYKKNGHMMPMH